MKLLTEAAMKNKVAIGAHPSFLDKKNFGRSNMGFSRQRIYEIVLEQIHLLNDIVKTFGSRLHHVKPHGALYNMAAKDRALADAIAGAVRDFDSALILVGLSGSELIKAGEKIELRCASEVFADRSY